MADLSIICKLGKHLSATCKLRSSKAPLWVRVYNYEVLEACLKLLVKGVPAVADD